MVHSFAQHLTCQAIWQNCTSNKSYSTQIQQPTCLISHASKNNLNQSSHPKIDTLSKNSHTVWITFIEWHFNLQQEYKTLNRNALELQKSREFKDEKINTNAIPLLVDNGDKRQWFYFNLLPFRYVSRLLLLPEFIFFFSFF